jgi:hypothetical protein
MAGRRFATKAGASPPAEINGQSRRRNPHRLNMACARSGQSFVKSIAGRRREHQLISNTAA